MSLVKAKQRQPLNYTNKIAAKIQQRRLQILVHSRLYYELDITLVSDDVWNRWAQELACLQRDNPDIASQVIYHREFMDFDGSSGFDLPTDAPQIVMICDRLLYNRQKKLERSFQNDKATVRKGLFSTPRA